MTMIPSHFCPKRRCYNGVIQFSLRILVLVLLLESVQGLATKARSSKNNNSAAGGKGFGASKEPTLLHTPDTAESTQRLIQFLKAQNAKGVEQGVVEIGIKDGKRGMFATQNIKKDQIVCMIPSNVALALSDPSKKGEDAPTFAHGGLNFLQMYCNKPEARQMWAPYLDTLPKNKNSPYFDPTPDYYSEEEIELLEFPRLIKNIRQRKQDIAELAKANGMTYEELQFATWLVSSRAFNINLAEEDKTTDDESQFDERGQLIAKAGSGLKSIRVMVPFLDMVNHDSMTPNCRFTMIDPEKDDAWFAIEANRPIPVGKEIKIAYRFGVYSTVELLLNYGFVPEQNKVDTIMLRKGGDDTIASLDGWTTTLEEDQSMLNMMEADVSSPLKKILEFRKTLKEAYRD